MNVNTGKGAGNMFFWEPRMPHHFQLSSGGVRVEWKTWIPKMEITTGTERGFVSAGFLLPEIEYW